MEHNGLAGQLGGIVFGEGDVDILLLTGLHADELILKAGDKAAGADLQIEVLALAAVEATPLSKPSKSMVAVSPFFTARSTLTRRLLRSAISLRRALTSAAMTFTSARGPPDPLYWPSVTSGYRHGALKDHAVLAAGLQLHLGIAHDLQLLLLHGGLIGVGQHDVTASS